LTTHEQAGGKDADDGVWRRRSVSAWLLDWGRRGARGPRLRAREKALTELDAAERLRQLATATPTATDSRFDHYEAIPRLAASLKNTDVFSSAWMPARSLGKRDSMVKVQVDQGHVGWWQNSSSLW